jgi:hypothetical protein
MVGVHSSGQLQPGVAADYSQADLMFDNGIAKCVITKGRYLTSDRLKDLAFKPKQIQEMP